MIFTSNKLVKGLLWPLYSLSMSNPHSIATGSAGKKKPGTYDVF
ncbi:hypothetical protein SAMN04488128_1011056 [Chitinophaga eiseniae]|uniref:Uncharacterized protein n=1 Tax=Chitinophaga eiseniae TaxID=634771 RepID=A0A1T4MCS0_9BACT|nr:hypothetical protein SAMN04488128_1011056 [Chitinophaga eiseniae]